ncbi:MAG: DUF4876 domain-containing protein [Muribaculaceae bacterium]|nr:DUF4876 domain-containing protein [Muribaculaceae bacterium]
MKKFFYILPIIAMILGFASCSSNDDDEAVRYDVTVKVTLPSEVTQAESATAAQMTVTVFNTSTSQESKVPLVDNTATVSLAPGTYNFTVSGEAAGLNVNGFKTGIDVFAAKEITIDLIASVGSTLVFKEVYFSGVPESYFQDAFYEIYNNTDEVQYLDGVIMGVVDLGLAPSTWNKDQPSGWMADNKYIDGRYPLTSHIQCFPGNGTEYPIEPRTSVIVAANPIDHSARALKENDKKSSVNLSSADWQLYTDNAFPADTKIEGIPNMTLLWKSWGREMMPATEGQPLILARLKTGNPVDYAADESSIAPVPGTTTNCFMIPADCILDAIDIVPADPACHFKRIEAKDDAGLTWVTGADGTSNGDYSGKSLRRKVAGKTPEGKIILKDTNNSSNDFETGGSIPTPGIIGD